MINTKLAFCGCCGETGEISVDNCEEDYYCTKCMGDSESKSVKKRLGWAGRMFFEARFPIIRKQLNDTQKAKWDSFSYEKKCGVIGRAIEKGLMI